MARVRARVSVGWLAEAIVGASDDVGFRVRAGVRAGVRARVSVA